MVASGLRRVIGTVDTYDMYELGHPCSSSLTNRRCSVTFQSTLVSMICSYPGPHVCARAVVCASAEQLQRKKISYRRVTTLYFAQDGKQRAVEVVKRYAMVSVFYDLLLSISPYLLYLTHSTSTCICLSVCLSVCLPACPLVRLCIYLPVYMSLYSCTVVASAVRC